MRNKATVGDASGYLSKLTFYRSIYSVGSTVYWDPYISVKRYKSIGMSRMTMTTVTGLFKGTCVPLDRMRYMQSAVYAEIDIGIPVDVRTLLA